MTAEEAVEMYTSGRTGTGHHAAPQQQDQLATAKSAAAELLRRNKSRRDADQRASRGGRQPS